MKNTKDLNIPERLYFPLTEAAEKLGCSIRDVVHLGAIGALRFSIFLNSWSESEGEKFNIIFDPLDSEPEKHMQGGFIGLQGKSWSLTGYVKDDLEVEPSMGFVTRFAKHVRGFYHLPSYSLTDVEFNFPCEVFRVHNLFSHDESSSFPAIKLHSFSGVMLDVKNLCILTTDLKNINSSGSAMPVIKNDELEDSPKTVAKKGEIIPNLLRLIPEFANVDLDAVPVAKVISILESLSADKRIEFPKVDKGTWAKYLGRK